MKIVKTFTTPLGEIRLYEDGIIRPKSSGKTYTMEDCIQDVEICKSELNGETYPWVIDARYVGEVPEECHKYLASKHEESGCKKLALIVNELPIPKFIVNTVEYIKSVSGYSIPVKLFYDIESAEDWAKKKE